MISNKTTKGLELCLSYHLTHSHLTSLAFGLYLMLFAITKRPQLALCQWRFFVFKDSINQDTLAGNVNDICCVNCFVRELEVHKEISALASSWAC